MPSNTDLVIKKRILKNYFRSIDPNFFQHVRVKTHFWTWYTTTNLLTYSETEMIQSPVIAIQEIPWWLHYIIVHMLFAFKSDVLVAYVWNRSPSLYWIYMANEQILLNDDLIQYLFIFQGYAMALIHGLMSIVKVKENTRWSSLSQEVLHVQIPTEQPPGQCNNTKKPPNHWVQSDHGQLD